LESIECRAIGEPPIRFGETPGRGCDTTGDRTGDSRMNPRRIVVMVGLGVLICTWVARARQADDSAGTVSPTLLQLREEAMAVVPLMQSPLAGQFLKAAGDLPSISTRTIYRNEATRQYFTAAQRDGLDADAQAALKPVEISEERYYYTRYGTPIAYARAIELIGGTGMPSFAGKRVLDIGYGTIGHLRMMASCGAKVVGLDVDSFLTALYSEPGDTGTIDGGEGVTGTISLVNGRVSEEAVRKAIGDGYDVITSKNTLKRGYIHPPPEQNVDKRLLVDLGVDDATFVKTLFDILNPGGVVLIYNLSPKQADLAAGEKYIPWADGRCPFDRDLLEKTGFTVIEYDRNDDAAARAMGDALGWDEGEQPMDLHADLFAHYTLLRKPSAN
jgi:SAM-dependent methyltransferase